MSSLIGRGPDQVPTNQMLGTAAFIGATRLPVSVPQQTAFDLKANLISPSFTTPALGAATGTSLNLTGGVILLSTVENALTAHAGGGQASALALDPLATYHRISTCATTADSVRLPASVAGAKHWVANEGAASMQVYGAGTDTINSIATGTGVGHGTALGAWYVCTVAGNWTTGDNARTGTGGALLRQTSPTLITPALGVATATSVVASGKVTANGGVWLPITTQTGSTYTVLTTDSSLIANFAGTITYTLPTASSFTGRVLRIRTITANTCISASSNVVPMVGGSAGTAILAATAGKWADLQSDGSNWQIMAGN